jgi:hypothetical protein
MDRRGARAFSVERVAPILAGIAGLGWFWMELAPQWTGFEDTDDPAISLQFLGMHPDAWTRAGLLLGIAALFLIATVLARHRDLAAPAGGPTPSIAPAFVPVIALVGAVLFLGPRSSASAEDRCATSPGSTRRGARAPTS